MRLFTDPNTRLNEAMDHLKVHDHFALIYQSPEEKFETLLPFIRSGLARGDRYMYLSSEADARLALEVMASHGVDTAAALARGALLLTTTSQVLARREPFDPDAFMAFLSGAVSDALAAGFSNFRICIEKIWTLGSIFDVKVLIDYEAKLDLFTKENRITALCAYDAKRFSSPVIRDVIRTHPKIVMQGMLCSNYDYLPPEELLHPNQLDFEVKRLLNGMLETELHLYDLQMQNDMFMSMFKSSSAIAYVKDLQGRYLLINPSGAAFLGRSQEDILGHTDEELLSPESAQWTARADRQAMQSQQPIATLEWLTVGERTRTFVATRGGYCNRDGRAVGVFGIAADVTERREAEAKILGYQEQLRAKVAEVSRAEEQERRRISSALHDEIGQTLALAKIKLETLGEIQGNDDLSLGITRVRDLIDDVIDQTRSLTVELRPPLLYELGLEIALRALCEEFREQYGIMFSFEDDGDSLDLSDDLRIFLYRTVRELLVNVVKHSRATSAEVCICRDVCWISLVVVDNGVGFDPAAAEPRLGIETGFGLFSIRERLRHIGGKFIIRSAPDEGTRVIVEVPYLSGDH